MIDLTTILWFLGAIVVLWAIWFFGSIAWAFLVSYYEIKSAPREPMYICPVHGPIRKENIITFQNYEGIEIDPLTQKSVVKRGDMEYCILCFDKRLSDAERVPL